MMKKLSALIGVLRLLGASEEVEFLSKFARHRLSQVLLAEARAGLDDREPTERISPTRVVSNNEIREILTDLGCELFSSKKHLKYISPNLTRVKESLDKFPPSAVSYFNNLYLKVIADFFSVQFAGEDFDPKLTILRDFWRFARVLAAAKIMLEEIGLREAEAISPLAEMRERKKTLTQRLSEIEEFLDINLLDMSDAEIHQKELQAIKVRDQLDQLAWIDIEA